MFKSFMTPRATTRTDIALAVGAVLMAIVKVVDTTATYKAEQADKKEKNK